MSLTLTPLASDNFNRANVSPLASPWAIDIAGNPGLQIVSDSCEVTTSDFSPCGQLYTFSLPNDQYVSVKSTQIDGNFRVLIRATDDGSNITQLPSYNFLVFVGLGIWVLYSKSTVIGTNSVTYNSGDVFTVAVVGTSIFLLQNGVQLATVTNATYSSGSSALSMVQTFGTSGVTNFEVGSASTATTYSISGNAGVAGATVSYSGTASGSVTADGSGNYTVSGLANGPYLIVPSKTGYVFSPTSASETISGTNITGVNFTATTTGAHYSVPDCRANKPNSATSRNVNGTLIYDVQTSSNPAIPPSDDRTAGAPIASGTYPQNSREPGVFGPGE